MKQNYKLKGIILVIILSVFLCSACSQMNGQTKTNNEDFEPTNIQPTIVKANESHCHLGEFDKSVLESDYVITLTSIDVPCEDDITRTAYGISSNFIMLASSEEQKENKKATGTITTVDNYTLMCSFMRFDDMPNTESVINSIVNEIAASKGEGESTIVTNAVEVSKDIYVLGVYSSGDETAEEQYVVLKPFDENTFQMYNLVRVIATDVETDDMAGDEDISDIAKLCTTQGENKEAFSGALKTLLTLLGEGS